MAYTVPIVEYINQAEEYLGLQKRYAELSDEELEALLDQMENLTEIARQVLRAEISRRRLGSQGLNPAEDPREVARRALRAEKARRDSTGRGPAAPGGPVEKEGASLGLRSRLMRGYDPAAFDVVGIWNASDSTEARRIMEVLDYAGIKAFLGSDNVERAGDYKGSYEDGVEIKVMKFQGRIALMGLWRLFPPKPEDVASESTQYAIFCPNCSSQDVIFQGLDVEPGEVPIRDAMYNWTCAACGYEWKDEGVQKLV